MSKNTNNGAKKAAKIAVAGSALSLILVVALHALKPEYNPSWRFLSEYAIGDFGWVMRLAFFSVAVSCLSLFVAVKSHVQTIGGKIGLGFLLATFVGLTMAGFFSIDPITATPDQLTQQGSLHGLASMIGIPSLPIAAMLISLSLGRNKNWASAKKSILWTANFTWMSVVIMFGTIGAMLPQAGGFGPDVLIGWPNRLLMLTYYVWLMTVASNISKLPNS